MLRMTSMRKTPTELLPALWLLETTGYVVTVSEKTSSLNKRRRYLVPCWKNTSVLLVGTTAGKLLPTSKKTPLTRLNSCVTHVTLKFIA